MKAILLIAHGSYNAKVKIEVRALVDTLQEKYSKKHPDEKVIFDYAFLTIEDPDVYEGIEQCVNKGAKEIVVLLNFLNSGRHADEDIPKMVDNARKKYPDVVFRLTPPLGLHPLINDLFLDLIEAKK